MYWLITVLMIFVFPIVGVIMLALGLGFNLIINAIDAVHNSRRRKNSAQRRKYA